MTVQQSTEADVNASEVVEKPTTSPEPSSEATKETKVTSESKKSDQELADEEIAKDLLGDEEEKPSDEEENNLEDKPDEEAEKPSDEEVKADEEAVAKGAEARKQALQTEIRELVSKRNELRGEVEQTNAKAYRTETPEELIEQGLSPEEAENEALKQEIQMREFNTHVADLNATLNIESLQVMQDFPVFDPDSDQFDGDLSARVRGLYEKAAQPTVDKKTGLVIKSNLAPYEFYKAFADTHESSGTKSRIEGKIEGEKASDKNLEAAETPSSTAPRKKAEDPFLKGLLSKDD